MGNYPLLHIDLNKIQQNTTTIVQLAAQHGISIMGVTKCCCGSHQVAQRMIQGGATSIADSRIQNIKSLKKQGIPSDLVLLRTPMISEIRDVITYADISLNSEITVIKKLSNEAHRQEKIHRVIIMVEMGDLREGIPPQYLHDTIDTTLSCKNIELYGLGMNLACFGGVIPTRDKIREFSQLVEEMEKDFSINLPLVSGGNSATIPLLLKHADCHRVNNLRIGEGILLGLETIHRTPIPGTCQDAFILEAEIIELQQKSSLPQGEISQDAFGKKPLFKDRGSITRGLLAIGRQDVIIEGLHPLERNVRVLGGSSDHLIVDVPQGYHKVGDTLAFTPSYGSLLHLFTSPYVAKEFHG
jgi:predicted amino acid racemase